LQITRLTDGGHQHSLGFGAAGTDLFFIIGGFILVYISHNRQDTFSTFLYRRMMRIAPLYWLFTFIMLAVLLVQSKLLLTTKFDLTHFLASLVFLPYPHPVLGIERPFLFPGWVLNHFVFFYLLFGSLLCLPTSRRIVVASSVLCVLVLLWFFVPDTNRLVHFYGAPVVLDFVLGMVVAWLFLEEYVPFAVIMVVFLAGAAIFTAGVLRHVSGGDNRTLYWGMAGAILVFTCVMIEKQWGWPNAGLLRHLGDTSYSVFVSHLFALALVTNVLERLALFPVLGADGARILFVASAWSVGMVVYILIERPLMRLLGRTWPERGPRVALVAAEDARAHRVVSSH
jgi:peptidoglycan/LPS O-acetylase OafA/YrhL